MRLNRNYAIVTAVMVIVIIYGSLYPFAFRVPTAGPGPVLTLLRSWADRPGRGDFISNVLLYAPLGFFGLIAVAKDAGLMRRLAVVVAVGTALSISMELTQYYDEGRETAATDVYSNALGTMLGAGVAFIFGGSLRWPLLGDIAANRIPAFVLTAWLAYRLYPYVPTIDLHKYWDTLKPIVQHPSLSGYDVFRYTAMWLALDALVAKIAGRYRSRLIIPLFAGCVLCAQILIITTTLYLGEIVGAGLGCVIWLALDHRPHARLVLVTALFAVAVAAERLEPFAFTPAAVPFGWIPFLSFMQGAIEVDVMSFLEKFFRYGGTIWLLTELGVRLRNSASLVAAMLLATSIAETHLPNRSAEITDAIMALVVAAIFALVGRTEPLRAVEPRREAAPPVRG